MLCNDVVIITNTMLKKILIIEDNVLLLEVMTYILINCGYEVFTLPERE